MRVMIRVMLGLEFLDADDVVGVLLVVLDLSLGPVPAHLRGRWRNGDLVVHRLLLLLEMGSPAGIFDFESLAVGELMRRLVVRLFVYLVHVGAATRARVDQVPFV